MIKKIKTINDIGTIKGALDRAKKEVAEILKKDIFQKAKDRELDYSKENFIYLEGNQVSDLVLVGVKSTISKFFDGDVSKKDLTNFLTARKCTDEEWSKFFNEHLK